MTMSATMTRKVSEYHDRLAQAVTPLGGREVTQGDVRAACLAMYPDGEDDLQWVKAADHSIDHTNRGPCECSRTGRAIFERLGRNRYRVRALADCSAAPPGLGD
jgi:hypothetical protein